MKRVMQFGKKGKLSPRYIGPFEIIKHVGPIAYKLAYPPSLYGVHFVLYMSMLKNFHGDGNFIIHWDSLLPDENISYKEEPVIILDRVIHNLRTKEIVSIKVQRKNRPIEEATLETKADVCNKYP